MSDFMKELAVLVLSSTAAVSFIQYLITRYDNKKGMEKQIKRLDAKIEEKFAILARTHILRFADDLRNGVTHSEDYFRQQLQDCDCYERYCEEHPHFSNGFTELASKYIKEEYKEKYLNHDERH